MNDDIPFPYLIPINTQLSEYRGFINVLGKEYPIEIKIVDNNNNNNNNNNSNNRIFLEDLEINSTKDLCDILQPYSTTIKNRFLQCKNLNQFLYELKDIIDRLSNSTSTTTSLLSIKTTSKPTLPINVLYLVLKELDEIGWSNIVNIDKMTFSTFEVLLLDKKKREFSVEFTINENYPNQLPKVICDLPIDGQDLIERIENHNQKLLLDKYRKQQEYQQQQQQPQQQEASNNKYSVINILKLIEMMVIEYQEFFDIMDEIDSNSWVLQPENPKRSSTYRRIALGNNCSLCFEVSPQHPRAIPVHSFLGPSNLVAHYKDLMNRNLEQWQRQTEDNKSPIDNFQTLLNIKLPLRENTNIEEIVIECAICYSHKLFNNDQPQQLDNSNNNNNSNNINNNNSYSIPDIVCNNLKCQKQFHHTCIYEWLKSLPNPRYSVSTIFGKCPYCGEPIKA